MMNQQKTGFSITPFASRGMAERWGKEHASGWVTLLLLAWDNGVESGLEALDYIPKLTLDLTTEEYGI